MIHGYNDVILIVYDDGIILVSTDGEDIGYTLAPVDVRIVGIDEGYRSGSLVVSFDVSNY